MNRGRRAEQIFLGEKDYKTFFELLLESVELWNLRIAAYCQMPDHYHLTRQLRGENLADICREYGLKTHSSASSAVERVRSQIIKDRRFRKRVDKPAKNLAKRQTET
jgi:REP element-mobilizing transposase RayT